MRVFISSTFYDLIDIRAELAEQLRTMGIVPVLSDDKLSDFHVQPDVNSIETCLVNVASCDEAIVLLNQRYGPMLDKGGYGMISATHLEYRCAVERKIPVHVYVRDRLAADFAIWKRNGRSDSLVLPWVSPESFPLFHLLEEHATLRADTATSNWYFPFTSSIDLKAAVANHFREKVLPRRLVEAIQGNAFPLFDIDLEAAYEALGALPTLKFYARLNNVGGVPAFNCHVCWEHKSGDPHNKAIVSPGQSILMTLLYRVDGHHNGTEMFLVAEYESPLGIAVRDRFSVHGYIHNGILLSGGTLVERKFRRSPEILLKIEDV
jgi:hypothetical protein